MSVLVKGMKMPESCETCIMRDGLFCMASDYKRISYGSMLRREEWCPLVALPDKHGRLVDAGECAEYFWEHLDDNGMAGAMNAINDMPTIVESEDGE